MLKYVSVSVCQWDRVKSLAGLCVAAVRGVSVGASQCLQCQVLDRNSLQKKQLFLLHVKWVNFFNIVALAMLI